MIYALTSCAPGRIETQRKAIASWRRAGLEPIAFAGSFEEAGAVSQLFALDQVELFKPHPGAWFNLRPFVPITTMLDRVLERAPTCPRVLIVNSDIELDCTAEDIERAAILSAGGCFLFKRWDHDGDPALAKQEAYGIDALLMDPHDRALLPESWLCLGQPCWDYWIPECFAKAGRPVLMTEEPLAFHQRHERQWKDTYARCVAEHERVSGDAVGPDVDTFEHCCQRSRRYYDAWHNVVQTVRLG